MTGALNARVRHDPKQIKALATKLAKNPAFYAKVRTALSDTKPLFVWGINEDENLIRETVELMDRK